MTKSAVNEAERMVITRVFDAAVFGEDAWFLVSSLCRGETKAHD